MNRDLVEILACPKCKGNLQLRVSEEDEKEVINGELYCPACSRHYSIKERIPNLLPPEFDT
ncbi:MAG: hypothetical protein CL873_04235 [Dehalococcoidales bacterium]|jgi:uncharacterized protein YbaR (Trm112 family)|nr:hypothetical protein [Dehalococcoidales bacterium]|tara:strand:+ start:809 stop:991 length:183 start_codon:yes stop_codon:yes gene_type:complete